MTKTNRSGTTPAKPPSAAGRRSSPGWLFPAVIAAVVVVGILAVVLVATSGNDDNSGTSANAVEVAAEVTTGGAALPDYTGAGKDPALGMAAPTIGSVDFQGRNVEVGGATGSPYAVVFLAHWCPHCQAEVPRLVSLAQNGRIEGVEVVGVATGTSQANPNYPPSAWMEREDWPFGVMVDDAANTAARKYGLTGYPYLVLVDANGRVVGRTSGEVEVADLQRIFASLAKGEVPTMPGTGASSAS
ncbi:MAG: TlpA family protein disulfide reductase [Actinomycetota bacterium]